MYMREPFLKHTKSLKIDKEAPENGTHLVCSTHMFRPDVHSFLVTTQSGVLNVNKIDSELLKS